MKKNLVPLLLLLLPRLLPAQVIYTENSVRLQPHFKIGDSRAYIVNDESKIEISSFFPMKAEHQYEVRFTILDTTAGFTIEYSSQTISTKQSNWPAESIQAILSSGIRLVYRIDRGGEILGILNTEEVRKSLFTKMDSTFKEFAGSKDQQVLGALRDSLRTERGVEYFIRPLVLFSGAFHRPTFYKHKTWVTVYRTGIFTEQKIPGVIIPRLKKINLREGQATIEYNFIGNKDSAAKYVTPVLLNAYAQEKGRPYRNPADLPSEMKNEMEGEYLVNLEGWPIEKISFKRTEFFLCRSVSRTTMSLKK